MTRDNKKYCPGLIHLRKQLRALIKHTGVTTFSFYDGEDWERYGTDEGGIMKGSEMCAEVDAVTQYQVGNCVLQVIYDGPYDEDTAEEIVQDMNGAAYEVLS